MQEAKKEKLTNKKNELKIKMNNNVLAICLGLLGDLVGGTTLILRDMEIYLEFFDGLAISLCSVFTIEQIYEIFNNYYKIRKIEEAIVNDQKIEGKGYKMQKLKTKSKYNN